MTDEFLERARVDLDRVTPDAWVQVYGKDLLDYVQGNQHHLQAAAASSMVVGLARRAAITILEALNAFEKATGWSPERRTPKATPRRWSAAIVLAMAVRAAVNAFLVGSRPAIAEIIGPQAAASRSLEGLVKVARETAPKSPASQAALDRFEAQIWKLRDSLLSRTGHPVSADQSRKGKSVAEMVQAVGMCKDEGCWLYHDHPGDHVRTEPVEAS